MISGICWLIDPFLYLEPNSCLVEIFSFNWNKHRQLQLPRRRLVEVGRRERNEERVLFYSQGNNCLVFWKWSICVSCPVKGFDILNFSSNLAQKQMLDVIMLEFFHDMKQSDRSFKVKPILCAEEIKSDQ